MRAKGMTMLAIGIELGVSEMTVKHTMNSIYRKLNVNGLQEALCVLGWTVVPEGL